MSLMYHALDGDVLSDKSLAAIARFERALRASDCYAQHCPPVSLEYSDDCREVVLHKTKIDRSKI